MGIKLNKEQIDAVKHGEGPLLIIAGAGTGKTTVITERIKHLILTKKVNPGEILALTFTEKASREMEERVDLSLPYGYTEMWISTFHSFCDRILRSEALNIGLDTRYKLLSEAESIKILRDNIFEFDLVYFRPLGSPDRFLSGLLSHFSRLQDENITPSEYSAWVTNFTKKAKGESAKLEAAKWLELASAYKKYEELKIAKKKMDFGDLITKTIELFKNRKNVLESYQDKFKYILIDEFQDTNYAQNELTNLLAGKFRNITACGDDDQSIYRFRGAAVSNILQFKKIYKNAKVVTLVKNYRSNQGILDKAYNLIQHNNPDRLEAVENIDKKLVSQKSGSGEINFFHLDRVENEADAVSKKINELVGLGFSYSDCAILVRANDHFEPFARSLTRHAIPFQFLGPGKLFKQPEIIDLISYLKILYDISDSTSFYRVLTHEHMDVPASDVAKILSFSKKHNLPLYESVKKLKSIKISAKGKKNIKKFIDIYERHLKLVRNETAGQILYYFLEETGLLTKLLDPKSIKADAAAKNISNFFDKIKTYEVDHEDASVFAVVDWLELSSEIGESPKAADMDWARDNAVNILTVHSSKGLEFSNVFLVNLVSQRFPTTRRNEQIPIPDDLIKELLPVGDYHVEEERRLFYVGITRAKNNLYLTASDYYGEGKRQKRLSPFIYEALGEDMLPAGIDNTNQLSFSGFTQKEDSDKTNLTEPIKIDYLSFSQIKAFQICPLHFKLSYVTKIPTVPSAQMSFGISIHSSMEDLYKYVQNGKKITLNLIKNVLEKDWIGLGYRNQRHEKLMFEKGIGYLSIYFKEKYSAKINTLMLEKPFVVPVARNNEKPLRLGGKIDRVDLHPDGTIEIIDYKTSEKVPTQKEIDRDLQLSFYALAANSLKEKPFPVNPNKLCLSMYYFDKEVKLSTTRTAEELEKVLDAIFKIRKEIEKSDFKCSKNIFCEKCEFRSFCSEYF